MSKVKIMLFAWDDTFPEVQGTPIVIPGYDDMQCVFYKNPEYKGYNIAEVSTGLPIIPPYMYAKNKAQAVDLARQLLDRLGDISKETEKWLGMCHGGKPLNPPLPAKKKRKLKQKELF